jgi:hypothetical protein
MVAITKLKLEFYIDCVKHVEPNTLHEGRDSIDLDASRPSHFGRPFHADFLFDFPLCKAVTWIMIDSVLFSDHIVTLDSLTDCRDGDTRQSFMSAILIEKGFDLFFTQRGTLSRSCLINWMILPFVYIFRNLFGVRGLGIKLSSVPRLLLKVPLHRNNVRRDTP